MMKTAREGQLNSNRTKILRTKDLSTPNLHWTSFLCLRRFFFFFFPMAQKFIRLSILWILVALLGK